MSKFKKGDRVKIISSTSDVYAGTICTVNQDDSFIPWLLTDDGFRIYRGEEKLQLIQENTMQYNQGDILIQGDCEHKILAICGELYFLSQDDDFQASGAFYTQQELDSMRYRLKTPDSETIEINGKKYNRAAVTKRLEELDEVER